ncbi:hypothetical protein SAMN05421837_105373 [Amycolatopsis pretoriensis]|uniref:Uncharacterized protein n=1 Tax=Amycolatopsis pretoriensis TaxID=218821 RepID=A0A1H5QXI9_9PSEU|nr:hypothetical protein [Amycolatopsis pretoriensis]SEF30769.1 hypothetical protein SAMN05421837_105373 [Amycolatopsis pretoriensis]
MRRIPWIAVLLVAGCGQAGSGGGVACPDIGTRVGIGLTVPDPAGVTRATLDACWGDQCVTRPVDLQPETAAGATSCTGTGPDAACGASMVPTGGLQGFADIPGLAAEPVQVTVRFDDGRPHTVTVTPGFLHPGGPSCAAGGPQAQLVAGQDHELKPR